jgi:hypothetical protein
MPAPDVTIARTYMITTLNLSGAPVRVIKADFWLGKPGEHGPYTVEVPAEGFRSAQLDAAIDALAAEMRPFAK